MIAMGDQIDSFDAILNEHITPSLASIAPNLDFMDSVIFRGDDFARNCRRRFFAAAIPRAKRAIDVVESSDEGLQPALGPIFLAHHFREELLPPITPFRHGRV